MPQKENLLGKRFGLLIVIKEAPKTSVKNKWICICDCGNEVSVDISSLKRGQTKSCGCYKVLTTIERATKHGKSVGCSEYSIFMGMKSRCYNINCKAYHNYGGRGIIVCDRWLGENGFINFLSDMGERPSKKHSLDRIDNNGNYEKGNCRWATITEQLSNRRNTISLEYKNSKYSLQDFSKLMGVCDNSILYQIKIKKMSVDSIVQYYTKKGTSLFI